MRTNEADPRFPLADNNEAAALALEYWQMEQDEMDSIDKSDPSQYYDQLLRCQAAELLTTYAAQHSPENLDKENKCPICHQDHGLNLEVFSSMFYCPSCSQLLRNPVALSTSTK